MKEIREAARSIPVTAETEVLVVGGGPAGLAAALASARQGAETMLMERFGCFGGNITQACVETIAWYRHPRTIEAGGIGMEFEQRAVAMNAAAPEAQSNSHALHTEYFKYIADRMVMESAVRPLLHCYFVEPLTDGAIGIFPEFLDAYGIVILPTTGRYFQVPYGIMLPQRVENLLVAGRAVGGDQESHAATRQMMCCALTGQAAGIAAAVSLEEGVSTAEVDIKKVQRAIKNQGVRID